MTQLTFDLTARSGKIKPMNAVNNGPTDPGVRKVKTNFDAYKAAGIPFARNHDASFFGGYGGEHTVDVHRIFKNFDADENDPSSYIFEPTDEYLLNTMMAGTEIFYRLGASIEHRYKYGTRVPRDMAKWARICEHIIRHYNEGWANGFRLNIRYWEIWNEPDCRNADGSNPCWQGTEEEFIELYCITAKHLKACFPHLKIGGPAFCGGWILNKPFYCKFLEAVARENAPMDFFSYHWYGKELSGLADAIRAAQKGLEHFGLGDREKILNEWNYVRGWQAENWDYSLATEKNLKGSAFVAGAMCVGQALPLDMLMYYDARPCGMNGLFAADTFVPLKPYYAFLMFRELARLGCQIPAPYQTENIYSCAAADEKNAAVMLSYFTDDDGAPDTDVRVEFTHSSGTKKVTCFVLDAAHNLTPVREEIFTAETFALQLHMPLYSSMLIKIESI